MTDATDPMAALDEIRALLDRVGEIESQLADNEREMYLALRGKYADACEIGFEDKLLLEVMLRNVGVREQKGVRLD